MDLEKLANLIFPSVKESIADLEKKFPKRNLNAGAEVTRFALLLLDFFILEHFSLL